MLSCPVARKSLAWFVDFFVRSLFNPDLCRAFRHRRAWVIARHELAAILVVAHELAALLDNRARNVKLNPDRHCVMESDHALVVKFAGLDQPPFSALSG
jgi:hypothetical protein